MAIAVLFTQQYDLPPATLVPSVCDRTIHMTFNSKYTSDRDGLWGVAWWMILITITAKVLASWACAPHPLLASPLLSLADNRRNWPYDVPGLPPPPPIAARSLITPSPCFSFFTQQYVMEGRRSEIIFLFRFFYYFLYIFLSKDCIHCNVCTRDEEWVTITENARQIICAPNRYWHNVHKRFLTRKVCKKIKTGIWRKTDRGFFFFYF
jgi:hypothetical protein